MLWNFSRCPPKPTPCSFSGETKMGNPNFASKRGKKWRYLHCKPEAFSTSSSLCRHCAETAGPRVRGSCFRGSHERQSRCRWDCRGRLLYNSVVGLIGDSPKLAAGSCGCYVGASLQGFWRKARSQFFGDPSNPPCRC